MSNKIRLTDSEKVFILRNCETKSLGRISQILSKSRSTIQSFIRKFNTRGIVSNIRPRGRNKIIISRLNMKRIVRYMTKHKGATLKSAINHFNLTCSIVTLSRRLREIGIGAYKEKIKSKLTYNHINMRKIFANKYKNWSRSNWKRVIYADSSSIELGKNYISKEWRKRGVEKITERPRRFIIRYIKMYAAISFYGKSRLIIVDKRFTNKSYLEFMEENWNQIRNDTMPHNPRRIYLLHDNEKPHNSTLAQIFFRRNGIDVIQPYPPNSGDLNPIENIWFVLKKAISKKKSRNLRELTSNAISCWNEIDQNLIKNMILSMNKRINKVLSNKGSHTLY